MPLRSWSEHLSLVGRLDASELQKAFPALPTDHRLFWVHVYAACMILTERIPEVTSEQDVTEWHIVRGRAKTILHREGVKIQRHTKRFEFRGKLYHIPVCLLELPNVMEITNDELIDELARRNLQDRFLHTMPDDTITMHLINRPVKCITDALSCNQLATALEAYPTFMECILQSASTAMLGSEYYSRPDCETAVAEITPTATNISDDLLAEVDVDAYQDWTDTTWSSPADAERWNAALPSCLQMIGNLGEFIAQSNFDVVKKFCAYGRLPIGMVVVQPSRTYNWVMTHPDRILKAASSPELSNPVVELMHAMFGLITEIEEMCMAIVKNIDQWHGEIDDSGSFVLSLVDKVNMLEELGDAGYYIGRIAKVFGYKLSEVFQRNKAKLSARYGAKEFTAEAANNRDLEAERAVLSKQVKDHMPSITQECADSLAAAAGVPIAPAPVLFCAYCNKHGHDIPSCPERSQHLAEASTPDVVGIEINPEETERRVEDVQAQTGGQDSTAQTN